MTKQDDLSREHLSWLVRSRSANQKIALRLFKLLQDHPTKLKSSKNSLAAQALVAITFSLWRGVFLADKTGARGESLKHANAFLGKLIVNNAINYSEDRAAREWTYNYYVSNAFYRLRHLANEWGYKLAPRVGKQTPKTRWDYYHQELVKAVDRFTKRLCKHG
jgi:hypothetical protein